MLKCSCKAYSRMPECPCLHWAVISLNLERALMNQGKNAFYDGYASRGNNILVAKIPILGCLKEDVRNFDSAPGRCLVAHWLLHDTMRKNSNLVQSYKLPTRWEHVQADCANLCMLYNSNQPYPRWATSRVIKGSTYEAFAQLFSLALRP